VSRSAERIAFLICAPIIAVSLVSAVGLLIYAWAAG